MRIGIIGAGAMGGLFGGYLHENGADVHLYDVDEAIVDAIETDGLYIEHPDGDDLITDPPATTDPGTIGEVDVAIVFTKAYDTEAGVRSAEPMIGPDTVVASVQNGVRNVDLIERHVPHERVLGGCTRMGANTVRPGRVRCLAAGETVVGGPDVETAVDLADVLIDAGIDTTAVEDPLPYIWEKQFVNVAIKPVAALTELPNGPMLEYEETRDAMRQLIEETIAVARAKDIEILPDDPVGYVLDSEVSAYDKKSSILEDVENHRRTEIEHINGAVVDYGEEVGVDTPYNRIATELVVGKERSYL